MKFRKTSTKGIFSPVLIDHFTVKTMEKKLLIFGNAKLIML